MLLSFFRKKLGSEILAKREVENNSVVDIAELKDTIYGNVNEVFQLKLIMIFLDIIKTIKDPEKPNTLEELNVVYEDGISVRLITHEDIILY